MHNVFIGTSGFDYTDWKNVFYPEDLIQKDWLSFYAKQFKTVEINATFYHSFDPSTYSHWYDQTPQDFHFTVKGSRFITHIKRLKNIDEPVNNFFQTIQYLKEKLSVVLWQFPANFKWTAENKEKLIHFFTLLPNTSKQTFEFRHPTCLTSEVYELLNKNNFGFVINDSSVFPSQEVVTADFAYLRLHGAGALYGSKYSKEEIKLWAERINRYRQKYDVFAYFNNDTSGFAVQNAKELIKKLSK